MDILRHVSETQIDRIKNKIAKILDDENADSVSALAAFADLCGAARAMQDLKLDNSKEVFVVGMVYFNARAYDAYLRARSAQGDMMGHLMTGRS